MQNKKYENSNKALKEAFYGTNDFSVLNLQQNTHKTPLTELKKEKPLILIPISFQENYNLQQKEIKIKTIKEPTKNNINQMPFSIDVIVKRNDIDNNFNLCYNHKNIKDNGDQISFNDVAYVNIYEGLKEADIKTDTDNIGKGKIFVANIGEKKEIVDKYECFKIIDNSKINCDGKIIYFTPNDYENIPVGDEIIISLPEDLKTLLISKTLFNQIYNKEILFLNDKRLEKHTGGELFRKLLDDKKINHLSVDGTNIGTAQELEKYEMKNREDSGKDTNIKETDNSGNNQKNKKKIKRKKKKTKEETENEEQKEKENENGREEKERNGENTEKENEEKENENEKEENENEKEENENGKEEKEENGEKYETNFITRPWAKSSGGQKAGFVITIILSCLTILPAIMWLIAYVSCSCSKEPLVKEDTKENKKTEEKDNEKKKKKKEGNMDNEEEEVNNEEAKKNKEELNKNEKKINEK